MPVAEFGFFSWFYLIKTRYKTGQCFCVFKINIIYIFLAEVAHGLNFQFSIFNEFINDLIFNSLEFGF